MLNILIIMANSGENIISHTILINSKASYKFITELNVTNTITTDVFYGLK